MDSQVAPVVWRDEAGVLRGAGEEAAKAHPVRGRERCERRGFHKRAVGLVGDRGGRHIGVKQLRTTRTTFFGKVEGGEFRATRKKTEKVAPGQCLDCEYGR